MPDNQNLSRILRRMMSEYPDGPLNVTDLSRLIKKPRATIHRHLLGKAIKEETIEAYARALTRTEADYERAVNELKITAGLPMPHVNEVQSEVAVISYELRKLNKDGLDAVLNLLNILKKTNSMLADNNGDATDLRAG
jgi:hypothetical protein